MLWTSYPSAPPVVAVVRRSVRVVELSCTAAALLQDRVAVQPYVEPQWSGRAGTRRFAARPWSEGEADGLGPAGTAGRRAARLRPARRSAS